MNPETRNNTNGSITTIIYQMQTTLQISNSIEIAAAVLGVAAAILGFLQVRHHF